MNRRWGGAAVVAVLVATVALLLVAASSDAVRVWSDPPASEPRSPVDGAETTVDPESIAEGRLPAPTATDGDSWPLRVAAIVVGALLLRWAWIVIRFWAAMLRRRRDRRIEPVSDFAVLPADPIVVGADLSLDETAQLDALGRGGARNAIVACWVQLEHDVAAAGLVASPSETSAEFTERVLARATVDAAAVVELAELYREARFSRHELGDRERDRAHGALVRIHASLRTAAPMLETDAAT